MDNPSVLDTTPLPLAAGFIDKLMIRAMQSGGSGNTIEHRLNIKRPVAKKRTTRRKIPRR